LIHCDGFTCYAFADGTFHVRRFLGEPAYPERSVPYERRSVPVPTAGPLTHAIAGIEKPKRIKKLRGVPVHIRK
jgi:hypothetical protein